MELTKKDIHKYIADHTEMWDAMNDDTLFSSVIKEIDDNANFDSVLSALMQMVFTSCTLYEGVLNAVKAINNPDTVMAVKHEISNIEKRYNEYLTNINNLTSTTSK